MFEIIPAIDILNGRVVRLTQGDYDRVQHFDDSPVTWAKRFEQHGAKKIHLVDLDGAKDGKLTNLSTFQEIRKAVSCELELGGGIRTMESVHQLVESGIDLIVIGSLLIKNPELAHTIINRFAPRIIAGIDAKKDHVAVEGWLENSQKSVASLINEINEMPLAYIIYTDISRDGMMSGPNIESLKSVANQTTIPVIASGGIRDLNDIQTLKKNGINGCIIGKAILNGKLPLEKIWL